MSQAFDFTMLSPTVRYHVQDRVAIITIDNPPVNGLNDACRRGIHAGVQRFMEDADVDAAVLMGAGKGFSGGADIRQFNTAAAQTRPMTRDIIALIEQCPKPVIAAIHGIALGGGLELALGCHYRVATRDARLGLPEVNLGLIPGGGGTQRLPRLIGVAAALDLIQSGKTVSGAEALSLGLVDGCVDNDLLASSVDFARRQLSALAEHPVLGRKPMENTPAVEFSARLAAVSPKARNAMAQRVSIQCVEAAVTLPFEDGLTFERARFDELVAGPESTALRHLFFAEREAPKLPGVEVNGHARPVSSVAILGAGTMGVGIAMAFANAGIPVRLVEREPAALDRGLALIRNNYEVTAGKGKLSRSDMEARIGRITPTLNFDDIANADLVIEAVFEDMTVKKDLFARLDKICKPNAILATNTSRLSIDEMAAATTRPQDVVGLHFFSPANVMRLLEVVQGDRTGLDVIAACMQMAQQIGKIPVLVKVCEGFVGNRMLTPYWREAGFLLEEGASPVEIDSALTRFGMAMGPLTMADLAGLDINWATRKRLAPTRPGHLRYSKVADRICEMGRFGQKTGAGYYRYAPGSRTPVPDPEIDGLIVQCAAEAGMARREVTEEEIVDRCMLALVNEGAHILEEGIAQRASDIDVVYVHGYGFPAWRGGPMYYAQMLGLPEALRRIRALRDRHGEHWTPAPLLEKLVASGAVSFP